MAEEWSQTQTQTQGSQVEWSQGAAPSIPAIWGRLYRTANRHCWRSESAGQLGPADQRSPEYLDLTTVEFKLGRALTCDFAMKKDVIRDEIINNVSKLHFILRRDNSATLSPAVLVDCSYNGTFVNGTKVGKGRSRVLDDNDEISITHPMIKIFVFKDLQKNEQDQVPKEISHKYYVSRTLGQGACGVVKLVYNKLQCTRHAMKIIKKSQLSGGQVNNNNNNLNNPQKITNEVNILKQLRHPCIISTEEIFESRHAVYIVLELMEGGELFDRITQRRRLPEPLTKLLFRQMVLAVQYLHSQGITHRDLKVLGLMEGGELFDRITQRRRLPELVTKLLFRYMMLAVQYLYSHCTHRDLKPENVLLEGLDEETVVKISDFGLSKLVGEHSFMRTVCGTPLYLAPEILVADGRSYGPQVDVWSLGVIFFICLSGYLPFSADYPGLSLRDQILRGCYSYSETHWAGVSEEAKVLMERMLTVDPRRRITLAAILESDWMQDKEIISRVDKLLSRSAQVNQFRMLSVASHSDEENQPPRVHTETQSTQNKTHSTRNKTHDADEENQTLCHQKETHSDKKTVFSLKNPKRMLSDTSSSCEPIPKKMRLGLRPIKRDKIEKVFAMNTERSDDTASARSADSDDSNYILIVK